MGSGSTASSAAAIASNPAIATGRADLISFGLYFLANPDLPERLRRDEPLNPADKATFYGGGAKGYTDYPTLDAVASADHRA